LSAVDHTKRFSMHAHAVLLWALVRASSPGGLYMPAGSMEKSLVSGTLILLAVVKGIVNGSTNYQR